MIVTDDQRALGTLQAMPATLRLFGEGGKRFTNGFATTPVCCPSRSSIFTGEYVHNHHVKTEADAKLLDQKATIQYCLQGTGYRTAMFGKYLNQWPLSQPPPYFDRAAIFAGSRLMYRNATWGIGGRPETIGAYNTTFMTQQAVRFLEDAHARSPDRPWYLYLATAPPHEPAIPPPRYAHAPVGRWHPDPAGLERNLSDKPSFPGEVVKSLGQARDFRARQLRTLMAVDDMVRAVFAELTKLGETRDTLAIFTSDNGMMWHDHGLIQKLTPYAPSVRVPLFLRWPGHVQKGAVDTRLAANIDIAPTIFDAAGACSSSRRQDGRSLLQRWDRDEILLEFWRDFDLPSWSAIWTRSYQYIEYRENGKIIVREYYDLKHDPYQLTNLLNDGVAGDDPPVAAMHAKLAELRRCHGSVGPSRCP